jgi:hypothetical protein
LIGVGAKRMQEMAVVGDEKVNPHPLGEGADVGVPFHTKAQADIVVKKILRNRFLHDVGEVTLVEQSIKSGHVRWEKQITSNFYSD